ncbi:MAG: DUF4342 domain-containing protein [Salana multivorans]|nr:DUF4342 domain-containing protein [Salana multivorans]
MTEDHTNPNPEHTDAYTEVPTPEAEAPKHAGPDSDGQTEEFTVSANKLLGKVKELINEGNVRKIILRNEAGNTLMEIPLNAGLAGVAAAAVFAPVLVAVGAIAALVTSVSITVVRAPKTDVPVEDVHQG